MMKHNLILTVLAAAVLAACSSTPTRTEPVKVEEVKVQSPAPAAKIDTPPAAPAVTAPVQKIAEAKPLPEAAVADSPFPAKGAAGALGQRSIYYAFDTFSVADEYKPVAEAHGGFLGKHAKARVLVQGNCDERGSREYNVALGMRRAEAAKSLLTLSGATGEQVEAVSFGKEKPADPGHDEAAWSKNRRVDIVYQGE